MSPDPCYPLRFVRCMLALAAGLAMMGCATAPAPATKPQWIAMSLLAPAAVDPDAPWFTRAASLVLRNELGTVPGLMVVVPPPEAAATLAAAVPEVEWIVGGSVARGGGRTRFEITLRRKSETSPSWQRRFEYASDGDASQWRRDIPAAVAAQLGVGPKPAEAGDLGACRSAPASDDTLRAIEAYGNYRTREDILRVRGWLEQALRQEPGCPEAQAQRAMTHVSELANRWSSDAKAQLELADQLSRQVVATHPRQPFGYLARLQVLRMQGQVAAAVQEATTLTQIDPSNSLFVGRLAALKFDAGDAAGTLAAARQMQALPNGTFAALQQGLLFEALARYSLGDEEQSAAALRKLLALNPRSSLGWQLLAGIEALHGRDAEAAAALQRFLALAPAGQSIQRLRANETTVPDGQFKQQRERYYRGLRRAGLPE
jgi:tetratricopeptide (TPR) repeat protein